MNWPVLIGKPRPQPVAGGYTDWKADIAAACDHRCIYCSLHESENGGVGNFHIDHLRPKSVFAHLRDIIANLFLSCAICNRFKSDDWPAEPVPDLSVATYIDPASADYNATLSVDDKSFQVSANSAAGRYTVERLYLNRPQMIRHWRARFLARRIGEMEDFASRALETAQKAGSGELTEAALELAAETIKVTKAFRSAGELPPYAYGETSRPRPVPSRLVRRAGLKRPKKR